MGTFTDQLNGGERLTPFVVAQEAALAFQTGMPDEVPEELTLQRLQELLLEAGPAVGPSIERLIGFMGRVSRVSSMLSDANIDNEDEEHPLYTRAGEIFGIGDDEKEPITFVATCRVLLEVAASRYLYATDEDYVNTVSKGLLQVIQEVSSRTGKSLREITVADIFGLILEGKLDTTLGS